MSVFIYKFASIVNQFCIFASMKCFSTNQIRQLDAMTIEKEGITSVALMDRAGMALFQRIRTILPASAKVAIVVGPGNNGGDGLVIARLLHKDGFQTQVFLCHYGKPLSADAALQLEQLRHIVGTNIIIPSSPLELDDHFQPDWLIDALFGSGLNRPLSGFFADTVEWMNNRQVHRISIDLPSGLFSEDNSGREQAAIVKADITLGLQCPRLAFLLPENGSFVGNWELVDIGLDRQAMLQTDTPWSLTTPEEAAYLLKRRSHFAHKGQFGRTLLIAGSPGMTGACILAGRGALRAGTGLLTLKVPTHCLQIVQTALPEAMAITYASAFWNPEDHVDKWSAIAVGPGLGTQESGIEALESLLDKAPGRLVLDADALNLLALKPDLYEKIPSEAILTPHPGEFDRMTKHHNSGFERLQTAMEFSRQYGIFIILKGAYSACITPLGRCRFNQTGNPGMATGGSGDVLTGIVVSLLSQGYAHEEACVLGTCLHGLSADLALDRQSQESLIARDIADNLGNAFHYLNKIVHSDTP